MRTAARFTSASAPLICRRARAETIAVCVAQRPAEAYQLLDEVCLSRRGSAHSPHHVVDVRPQIALGPFGDHAWICYEVGDAQLSLHRRRHLASHLL